jgi:hypothetical protein
MNSDDLKNRHFGSWHAFSLAAERVLLDELPTAPGVYSMRLPVAQARRRGASNIAYVGKATNRNGLRGRIRQYFHPGWRQSTNLEMKARLVGCVAMEIAFVVTSDVAEAENLESEPLLLFEGAHGERPPFNKQAALAYLRAKASG